MRILVTGADGMLGSCLMHTLSGHQLIPLPERECDITDAARVAEKLEQAAPDVIIHTAARTDVEACQGDREGTLLVNVGGTENLLRAAAGSGAAFVSSTGIYGDHKQGPYTELDEVRPTTVHHWSKYEAERVVASSSARHLILRIGWLFGAGPQHPRNFVVQRCNEARGKDLIYADATQTGNPTSAENVARQLRQLIENQLFGVFNCVDRDPATRLDYVQQIIELAGLPCRVEAAPDGFFKRIAPVSPNESAVNQRLDSLGIDLMEDWRGSLARYMESLDL
jgi:dTDP-4-dehydrorhamnose reductase